MILNSRAITEYQDVHITNDDIFLRVQYRRKNSFEPRYPFTELGYRTIVVLLTSENFQKRILQLGNKSVQVVVKNVHIVQNKYHKISAFHSITEHFLDCLLGGKIYKLQLAKSMWSSRVVDNIPFDDTADDTEAIDSSDNETIKASDDDYGTIISSDDETIKACDDDDDTIISSDDETIIASDEDTIMLSDDETVIASHDTEIAIDNEKDIDEIEFD